MIRAGLLTSAALTLGPTKHLSEISPGLTLAEPLSDRLSVFDAPAHPRRFVIPRDQKLKYQPLVAAHRKGMAKLYRDLRRHNPAMARFFHEAMRDVTRKAVQKLLYSDYVS